ncbi:hypothetical protein V8C43DRAFT_297391 [Trichoderma afarasin]
MYACMYLTEFPSCLLFHPLNSATGKGSAKKRKLPWRWSWFAVVRTRTLTSLSPSSSQTFTPAFHHLAQPRSCSICSAHAHVSPRPTRSSCEVNISIPRDPPTTNRQKVLVRVQVQILPTPPSPVQLLRPENVQARPRMHVRMEKVWLRPNIASLRSVEEKKNGAYGPLIELLACCSAFFVAKIK